MNQPIARRFAATMAAVVVVIAMALAGCTPTPTPTPTAVPVPPQPDFATTLLPAGSSATAASTPASFAASYAEAGQPLDLDKVLNASQGGYGPMSNPRWFPDQFAQISSMGIREVRIDHVLNDSFYRVVSADAAGTISYDFSRLDRVILPIIANGMTPFISLSYMPLALGDKEYGPPRSLDAWAAAVTALIGHYRELGYTGWSYEVWNEPDTGHWSGTVAQYCDFYAATAGAVRAADPTALVGGAAGAYLTSDKGMSAGFIHYIAEHPDVPIDYFSVHSYTASDWSVAGTASQWLADAGAPALPIFITEWNNISAMDGGPGRGSDTNASEDGSSYIARRLFLALTSGAQRVFYFTPIEGYSYSTPYNGDLGLITVDGHRKSLGNVFEMYSRLNPTLVPAVLSGAGTDTLDVYGLMSKDDSAKTGTVLLWNNTAADVAMSVDLTDLPYGSSSFRVTAKAVSGTQGNGFADGPTQVSPVYPSPNENAPVVSDTVYESSASYSSDIVVPANGVVSLALSPTDEPVGPIGRPSEPAMVNLAAAASGAVPSASTSLEAPDQGWSVSALNDGRRYSLGAKSAGFGWASSAHPVAEGSEAAQIDLGVPTPVDTVVLWPRTVRSADSSGFPTAFTIEGSLDGVAWTQLHAEADYNGGVPVSGSQAFGFAPGEYRYLKVTATALARSAGGDGTQFAFELAEFAAFRLGVPNGGFETGNLQSWKKTGVVSVSSTTARTGSYSAALTGSGSDISMTLSGLRPDTTYTLGGHIRVEAADGAAELTVEKFGRSTATAQFASTQWTSGWTSFTTGPESTSAVVSLSVTAGDGRVWADDIELAQVPRRARSAHGEQS